MRPVLCKVCRNSFINQDDNKINVVCPKCKTQYCNKNKTERTLFQIQDRYIKGDLTRDQFITKVYYAIYGYTQSLILQNFRNRLRDPPDLDIYTTQSMHYFFTYYLEDNDFYITSSFSGMIFHKIRQAINEKSNHMVGDLSLDYSYDEDHNVQYEDTTKDSLAEIDEYENRLFLLNYIKQLVFGMEDFCNDRRENFIRLNAISHYLKYGEKKVDNLFKNYTKYGRIKYDETLELIHSELKRLYK